jgi:hypothetical protein
MNGTTLTLPTKSSATRSMGRPSSIISQNSPLSNSAGKTSMHHMSTESLQSPSVSHRQSIGSTGTYGLRNSPSMDRLATPRNPGATTVRNFVTASSGGSVKPTPMRKWTSNSDFQNGNSSSASHNLSSPINHNSQNS